MAITLASSMCMTSFGYHRLDYKPGRQSWRWEDWDDDGVYECYYYKDNGNRGFNLGVSPDGYELNEAGQWTIGGVVQTRTKDISESTQSRNEVNTNIEYDPARPLARMIDSWDLKITPEDNYLNNNFVSTINIQAMLTGQMDQYYDPIVSLNVPLVDGWYNFTSDIGNDVHISEEAYRNGLKNEQDLYNWFCEWLNSFEFENMTEMERAKEIQKVLGSAHYDYDLERNGDSYCRVLIEKKGICSEFALTACALAKALGLKSAVSGSGTHAVYYIQVDGTTYGGQNQALNLDYVYTDVFFWQ